MAAHLWIHLDTQILSSKRVNCMNHISIKLFLNRNKAQMKAKSFDSWLGLKDYHGGKGRVHTPSCLSVPTKKACKENARRTGICVASRRNFYELLLDQ